MLGWSTLNQALRSASSQMTVSRGAYSSGTARCAGGPPTSTSTVRTVVADTAGEPVFTQLVGGYMSSPLTQTEGSLMSTTSSTEQEARGVVDQASEKVHDAAAVAHEKAGELAETGRSRLSEQLDTRTSELGSQTRSVAEALRRGNLQLEADGEEVLPGVVVRAAGGVDRIGSYLQQQTGDELLRDVEQFARRRPWLTAGVALVAGVALSRFLKSSSEDRYREAAGQEGNRSTAAWQPRPVSGTLPATAAVGAGSPAEW